jgi:hypothetical protein
VPRFLVSALQHFAVNAKKGNALAACELLVKRGADSMVRRAACGAAACGSSAFGREPLFSVLFHAQRTAAGHAAWRAPRALRAVTRSAPGGHALCASRGGARYARRAPPPAPRHPHLVSTPPR